MLFGGFLRLSFDTFLRKSAHVSNHVAWTAKQDEDGIFRKRRGGHLEAGPNGFSSASAN